MFSAANLIWLPSSTVNLDRVDFVDMAKVGALLLTSYASIRIVDRRLRFDNSRIARAIRDACKRARLLILGMTLFVPLLYVGTAFMYIASATQRQFIDSHLAVVDAILGFNWVHFLDAVNSAPLLSKALVYTYHSLSLQVPFVGLLLAAALRAQQLFEFIALFAISLFLSCLLMAGLPAEGAYAYFQPPAEAFSNFTERAGSWHLTHLNALRSGESFQFSARIVEGLITFPSFHTVLGIIVVYALRGFRLIAISFLIVNVLMIIGTMPEGGHHLVDVLAGIAVTIISIAVTRGVVRLYPQTRDWSTVVDEASTNTAKLSNS
ncbi:phosphatase PAP2 family protein [Borborobacter arsenicus]|nr:phosphatase PAP2 family protein [Pseudaminobacter arsenicus]